MALYHKTEPASMTRIPLFYENFGKFFVTVHSVLSNTLCDAQKLCILHNFVRCISRDFHAHVHENTSRNITGEQ